MSECPICFNVYASEELIFLLCCKKEVCVNCSNEIQGLENGCAFCRQTFNRSSVLSLLQERDAIGDLDATYFLAEIYKKGSYGVTQSVEIAIQLYEKLANTGRFPKAWANLSIILNDKSLLKRAIDEGDDRVVTLFNYCEFMLLEEVTPEPVYFKRLLYHKELSISKWRLTRDFVLITNAYGLYCESNGDIDEAKKWFKEGAIISRSVPDSSGVCLYNLARFNDDLELFYEASQKRYLLSYTSIMSRLQWNSPVDAYYWGQRYLKEFNQNRFKDCRKEVQYHLDNIYSFLRTNCQCCRLVPFEKKLFCCGGCKVAHYCNKTCQKNHWSEHKVICKKLRK